MDKQVIDKQQALALLERAVKEKGEGFVYVDQNGGHDECSYFHDDKPGCIVGHVMSYLGMTVDDLDTDEWHAPDGSCNVGYSVQTSAVRKAFLRKGIILDNDAVDTLLEAQRCQDRGISWAEAVNAAHTPRG